MPGPQPDGLEALEDRDVLGRVAAFAVVFAIKKSPAKPLFCGLRESVSDGAVSSAPARGSKLTAFCTVSRSFSSSIDAAIPAGLALVLGRSARTGSATARLRRVGSGSGPGAKRTPATPSRAAISAAAWPSSNAQTESVVCTCSVPSRAIRAGHALRAIASPTASGQRVDEVGQARLRPEARELARGRSDSLSRGHLHDLARLDRQRGRWVAVIDRLAHAPRPARRARRGGASRAPRARRRAAAAAASRRAARPRRAAARAAPAAARPASRSSAGRGRRRRSRRRRDEGRARSSRGRGRLEPRLERARGRRFAVVPERPPGRPSSSARSAKPARARRVVSRRASTSCAPERRRRAPSTARARRGRRGRAARAGGRRSVARARRAYSCGTPARAGCRRPSTRSK